MTINYAPASYVGFVAKSNLLYILNLSQEMNKSFASEDNT